MARITNQWIVNSDDGYVNHDLAIIDTSANPLSLMLGYNFYDTNGDCDWWARFGPLNIPPGSTIINAEIYFNVYSVSNGYVETELKVSLDRNTIPTTYSQFTSMTGTQNYVNTHWDPQTEEQIVQYNVTDIIQEKINQDDWGAGNNIIFFTDNTAKETSDSGADVDSYEYNPVMTLIITFDTPEETSFVDIFTKNRYEYFKYEHLILSSGNYKHNGFLENISKCKIKMNFNNDIVGTANFKMEDTTEINFITDAIRPWYYLEYNDTIYSFPLGTYLLSSPDKNSNGKLVTRNVQGYDFLKALDDGKLVSSVSYPAGTNVITTVKTILDSVGSWIRYNIEDSTETLAEDLTYEYGKSKLFIINGLLNAVNYYPLWANGSGVFMSIKWQDSYNKTWDFKDDNLSIYSKGINLRKNYTEMYNRVIVIAQQLTADTEPFYKVWTMEDEDMGNNPISYTNIGRYITKKFYSEATSQSYVDLRARREIRKMMEIEESINYNHAFITSRSADGLPNNGDSYLFKNELLNIEETYKIDSFSWILETGSLVNSTIRRVTDIE